MARAGAKKNSRFSTRVSALFATNLRFASGLKSQGDYRKILMELIEEDFTGRAFDNIKAIHSLVQVVEKEYARGVGAGTSEEAFVVKVMCLFFKYRNRPE